MTLNIDESWTATNYTNGASAGRGVPTEIVIHHWGIDGQTHAGIVNWFCGNVAQTSAHFVASAGWVHCLVSTTDVAWHAGNWDVNKRSIGIECRPEATDGDYVTVAELIKHLRDMYGDLPLRPHRLYAQTDCPGRYDLARLDRMARGAAPAPAPVKPAPKPQGGTGRKTYGNEDIHWVVEKGDTLSSIARYYGIPKDAQRIADHNGIGLNAPLKIGDKIWIPGPLYWVIEGPDEIVSIAAYYGLDADYLARLNGLPNRWATIYVGNSLLIKE